MGPKKPDRSKSKVINHEETQFQAYGNENASTKQKLKKESKLSHIEINIDQMTGHTVIEPSLESLQCNIHEQSLDTTTNIPVDLTKEIKTREVNDVELMHVKIDETDSLVEMDSNEYCAKAVETSEIDHSTKDAKKPSTEENFKTEQKYDEELEHEETTATKKKKKVNKQKLYKKNVQSQKEDEFVDRDVSESVGFKLHSLKTKPSSKKKKPKKNEAENEEELEVMQVMN